jgi:hypothetical protein
MEGKLNRETILKALALLDEALRQKETTGEICIFGGAAMILAFDAGFATRDVDAIFVPKTIISNAILSIAEELELPKSWLNDGVKGFISENEDFTEESMPSYENLRVIRPSARYLLAMKCLASRVSGYGERGDVTDIKVLWKHLACRSVDEVMGIVLEYYPPAQIPAKTQFLIEEIFDEIEDN